METLPLLKSKIADFPGYGDDVARRRSDELVRSYLGEAIADLQARLSPLDGASEGRIGDVLLRTGFTNQSVFKAYEDAARTRADYDAVAGADARVVEIADRAEAIGVANLSEYLTAVGEALDARDAVMDGSGA